MTNWRGLLDEAEAAKKKAQSHYERMEIEDSAKILGIHADHISKACDLADDREDEVVVSAMRELSAAMLNASADLKTEWEEAISSTPEKIKRFFVFGGDVHERVQGKLSEIRRVKKYLSAPTLDSEQECMDLESIIGTCLDAISEEFTGPLLFEHESNRVSRVILPGGYGVEISVFERNTDIQ
jgi:hypothetical protein